MKTLKTIILLFALSVSLVNCDKDDDDTATGNVSQGTMTAKIDGTDFSNSHNVGQATLAQLPSHNNIVIQASNSDGKSINIIINNYTGTGTYEINSSGLNPNTAVYTETDISNPANTQIWQSPYQNSPIGTVKITVETDDNLQGEFSFKAKNATDNSEKNITEGFFNLSKQTT